MECDNYALTMVFHNSDSLHNNFSQHAVAVCFHLKISFPFFVMRLKLSNCVIQLSSLLRACIQTLSLLPLPPSDLRSKSSNEFSRGSSSDEAHTTLSYNADELEN